jgi:phage-related minor tail protein
VAGNPNLTVRFLADFRQLTDATQQIERRLGGFGETARRIGAVVASAFAVREVVDFAKQAVAAAEESRKVAAQTEAVLRSTGGVANVTARDVANLADQLSRKAGIDDELIQSGQNVLLTFTRVRNEVGRGNDVFNQATRLALDMSVALKTDLQSAVLQVGKALNDPITGLTALRRAGVSFTEQQTEQIKALARNGDLLGAQKMILAELAKEFGGSAAAQATASDRLKVTWENLKEELGGKLLPVVDKVAGWLAENLPKALDAAEAAFRKIEPVIRPVKEALEGLFSGDFVEKLRDQFNRASDAVGGSGLADKIKGAFAGVDFGEIGRKLQEAFRTVAASFSGIGELLAPALRNVVGVLSAIWGAFGDEIVGVLKVAFTAVVEVLRGALEVVSGIIKFVLAVISGDWGAAWDAIKQVVDGVWDAIVGVIRGALGVLGQVVEFALSAIKLAWETTWNATKAIVSGVFDAIKGVVLGVVSWFGDRWDDIKEAFGKVWDTMRKKVSDIWDAIKDIVRKAVDTIKGWLDSLLGPIDNIISKVTSIASKVGGGIGKAFGAIKGAFASGVRNFEGGLALVGEAGPELVHLPRGADVIPLTGRGTASSVALEPTTVLNVTINALDPRSAAQAVIQAIEEWELRNGRRFARVS